MHLCLSLLRVSDYIIPDGPVIMRVAQQRDYIWVWRVVSTGFHNKLRIFPRYCPDDDEVIMSGFHRYSQILIQYFHIDGPILSLLCCFTLPRDSIKEQR